MNQEKTDKIQRCSSRLAGRSIKVVGLGGIGTPVAQAVAQFLAYGAIRSTLFLIDGDTFEEKNRERVLFRSGGNKAISKAAELSETSGDRLTIIPVPRYVTPGNVRRLVEECDIVLLAVDNHVSRRCLSNCCSKLKNVVLISGGNDGIEKDKDGTFGNVIVFVREGGRNLTSGLTRFHPEIATPPDKRPDQVGCAALAHSSPQLLFTNLAVAAAMLGAFYAYANGMLKYEEIFLDIVQAKVTPIQRGILSGR